MRQSEQSISTLPATVIVFAVAFLRLVFNHRQQRLAAGKVPKAADRATDQEGDEEKRNVGERGRSHFIDVFGAFDFAGVSSVIELYL